MDGNIAIEDKILRFYYETVKKLQKDFKSGSLFLEQASTSMIFGHEFGDLSLCSKSAYELLFLWNLSYPRVKNYYNKSGMDEILKPFSIFDNETFFDKIMEEDVFLPRKIYMMCRLAHDLENENDLSIALNLLNLKNKDYIESYRAFSKLKTIIRTGWIYRNVEKEYQENDSLHIMQMFALALAYFSLVKNINLDQKKVYEMILIHEIGEIIAGDIREGDKRHKTKHEIEKRAIEQTFSCIKTGNYFISLWEAFESRETDEALFVYQLDKIDPILKAAFLDLELNRKDLLDDFFSYEKERGTFEKGKVKKLFQYVENRKLRNKIEEIVNK